MLGSLLFEFGIVCAFFLFFKYNCQNQFAENTFEITGSGNDRICESCNFCLAAF